MGSTKISSPTPPAQPTTSDAVTSWVNALPQIYQTQLKYAPLEAQQEVELAQKYAAPLGQAYYEAQKQMYPETTALQEQLATQSSEGMQAGLPDWARESYLDTFRSQVGENALAGAGADYISRGLLEQQKNWQDYYRNLGLSVAGRQPLAQPSTPSTSNYMQGFTPNSVMNYTSSTYSPYASAYSNMYNTNAQMSQFNAAQPFQYMQGIGNLMQGVGGMAGGFGFGQGK